MIDIFLKPVDMMQIFTVNFITLPPDRWKGYRIYSESKMDERSMKIIVNNRNYFWQTVQIQMRWLMMNFCHCSRCEVKVVACNKHLKCY